MKALLLVRKRFFKQFWRNLISCFFVALSVFMMNFAFSYYRQDIHIDRMVKKSGLYENFIYVGISTKLAYEYDRYDKSDSISNEVDDAMRELKDSGEIENYWWVSACGHTLEDGTEYEALYYPQDFLSELNMSVGRGRWFDNSAGKDGLIPVVAGYNVAKHFKIGQKFSIDNEEKKYVLIGKLRKNERFFSATASGTGMDLNTIAIDADDLLIVGCDIETALGDSPSDSSAIMKTSEPLKDIHNPAFDRIANLRYTFTFKEIADRAHKDNMYTIRMQGILSLLTLMVCVIGVSCINLLMAVREKKTDSIYMLCGMDKKTAYKIIAIEGIIKGIIPTIAGLAWFFSYTASNGIDEVYTDCWNGIFSLLLIAIVYVFSSLYPIKQIAEMSPAEIVTSE